MNVPDLPTLNTLLAQCGCCTLPACGNATVKCESLSHVSRGQDDNDTDDHDAWQRRKNLHDAWQSEHDGFPAAHSAWVTAHGTWASCQASTPGTCGPEPVEPVDPPEPPAAGTEPTFPAGYYDVSHSCSLPYKQPDGALTDEVPTLYRTEAVTGGYLYEGDGWGYGNGAGTPPLSSEAKDHGNYHLINDFLEGSTWTENGESNITDGVTCENSASSPGFKGIGVKIPFDVDYIMEPTEEVCNATEMSTIDRGTSTSGTEPTLRGCDGPFDEEIAEFSWNYTVEFKQGEVLGSGISKANLLARAKSNILSAWPVKSVPGSCVASNVAVWPLISAGLSGGDSTATPPVPAAWPVCFSGLLPIVAHAQATATRIRYKMGVPASHMAHRLWIKAHSDWVTAHAAWVTAGSASGSEPLEPVEPQIYQYFAVQWDMMKFPKAWDAWRVLFDAWTDAKKEKEEWDACRLITPTGCGVAPTVPADPSANQPALRPSYVSENLFWVWNGGETEASQYSDWVEVAAPADEAQIRMVNRRVKCWKSVRTGVPPTFYGETYDVGDYTA